MRAMDRFLALAMGAAGLLVLLGQPALAQFQPQPGRSKVIVADVIIRGNNHISSEVLIPRLRTQPGGEYIPEVVQDDVRILYNTNQFKNVEATKADGLDGRVTVYFLVIEYTTIVEEVIYQGAKHLSKDELERLTGIRKGMPLSPSANKVACKHIEDKLIEEGRPFASCSLLSGSMPGDTKVIFNITEGAKLHLRSVSFCGNQWASSGRLMAQIHTKPILNGVLPAKYVPQAIDDDIRKIMEYYAQFGFLDVRISKELQITDDGRDLALTYHIQEGTRYTYKGTAQIHGNKDVPLEQLTQLCGHKAGEFYSHSDVDGNVNKIKDYIGYTGRNANVQAREVFDPEMPGVVTIEYNVEERPPALVGQVFIVGNERTRQNVIMRQLPLYPGQLLTYPDLRNAERNLQRINIFDVPKDGSGGGPTVTVLDPDGLNPYKDILVSVKEADTGSLTFGVGVNSNQGLMGNIVLNERNFDIMRPPTSFDDLLSGNAWRGAGQEFQVQAIPGTVLQRYSANWREPFLFETPFSLGDSIYYYTRMYNEYDEQRLGDRVTLGRRLNQWWSVSVAERVEEVQVNGVVDFAPPQISQYVGANFLAGSRGSVVFDSRDSYLRPTCGTVMNWGYEQCVGSYTFPVANFEWNQYFTLWQRPDGSGRQVLALHSQTGYAGPETPVFERFYAGGFGSLRGFQYRGVGPNIEGFMIGGNFMMLNSIEYQLPVLANDSFFLVAFCDSGTVEEKVEITNYRITAGFGVRIMVPMLGPVPIALDFGFPIHKAPTDITQVFSFSMGFNRW